MCKRLFRGKIKELCKYQGQWLIGYYAVDNGNPIIAISKDNGINGYICYSESIGQYTGETDINDTMIFEGDILQVKKRGETQLKACPIYFGKYIDNNSVFENYTCIGFYLKQGNECCSLALLFDNDFEVEIIGNIYDNPELLEE